ncbi:hypothetical protein HY624_00985 [Candidatus Uhrbacteria bacterium]|nr:hypothetical protein [Candidatus Uhrbacteria bacterium]
MSPKTRNAIGWMVLGAIAITGIIYCTWGSPYSTTPWLRVAFSMLIIYGVTYGIAMNVSFRHTLVKCIPMAIFLMCYAAWWMVEEGKATIPQLAIVLGGLVIVCAIGGLALYFFFEWLDRYSYGLTGNQRKRKGKPS